MAPIPSQTIYRPRTPCHLVPLPHKPAAPLDRSTSSTGHWGHRGRKSGSRIRCLCHIRPSTSNARRGLSSLDMGMSNGNIEKWVWISFKFPAVSAGGSGGDGGSGGAEGGNSGGRDDEEGELARCFHGVVYISSGKLAALDTIPVSQL